MSRLEIRRFEDLETLSRAGAGTLVAAIRERTSRTLPFHIALSGGSTPRPLLRILAQEVPDAALAGDLLHTWWGDERMVSPDREASNYRMARRLLTDPLGIPGEQVHRIHGEADDPDAEARRYETLMRGHFGGEGVSFDLALQGIGEDGHTASLFPSSPALVETARWALPVEAPLGTAVTERITLTLPVLNRSRRVWILAAGGAKREAVRSLLDHPEGDPSCPASLLSGLEETVLWADREALAD